MYEGSVFGPFHTPRKPIFYQHNKFGTNILINGGVCPQNWIRKNACMASKFYFRFQFRQVSSYRNLAMCDPTKFQPNDTQTGDDAQWPIDKAKFSMSVCTMGKVPTRKHRRWRNRTSDRESDGRFWIGKPVSYSSFLLTIRLSRLVSEIFACDRQTADGRTTRTITRPISGPGPANKYQLNTNMFHVSTYIKCMKKQMFVLEGLCRLQLHTDCDT